MDDFSGNLEGTVERVRSTTRSLIPEFEIMIELRGPRHAIDAVAGEASIRFAFPESEKSVHFNEARLPLAHLEPVGQNGTNVTVSCPLRTTELERIEEMREGGDIKMEIECALRGYTRNNDELEKGSITLNDTISVSDWNGILNKIGYHDNREFRMDLEADETVIRDVLTSVQSKIRRAERTHNDGDYESAIRACRDAIESLRHVQENLKQVVDEQKWKDFESNMGQFEKGFVGTLCHSEDKTNVEPPLKRDSDFVLGLTKSYVRFITQSVSEEG